MQKLKQDNNVKLKLKYIKIKQNIAKQRIKQNKKLN